METTKSSVTLTYLFIGMVFPDTVRINSPKVGLTLEQGADYPAGDVETQILDNRVIANFKTLQQLSDVGKATIRNIVADHASSICDAATIVNGAWASVLVDTCLGPDETVVVRFGSCSSALQKAFAEQGITPSRVGAVNLHKEGYFLRLALNDMRNGLRDIKFMRSNFYRAIESLRNGISRSENISDRTKQWEYFRTQLDLKKNEIEQFIHHPERHAEYHLAIPLASSEVDELQVLLAKIVTKYINWFHHRYLKHSRELK